MNFNELVGQITQIGLDHHKETILENSIRNRPFITKDVRSIEPVQSKVLVVSAGPSLCRENILSRMLANGFNHTERISERKTPILVTTDGAYIQCLKSGLIPDYVLTIDPHPTRIVRWFGDPDYERHSEEDDYFRRQDLDVAFRASSISQNRENIALVDRFPIRLVIASSAPASVVERTQDFDRYWFAPLVDNPRQEGSITKAIVQRTGLPAINTGGTVGTTAWVFAHQILRSSDIAVVGMDFGYYEDTPLHQTQEWNLLKGEENVEDLFPYRDTPWGRCRTSPTYKWYRDNFLSLLKASDSTVTNCSEHGILHGDRVRCMRIEEWI